MDVLVDGCNTVNGTVTECKYIDFQAAHVMGAL